MAIIISPTGAQILTNTDSARPRKGEAPASEPAFASLLAMLVGGIAPAIPPAGIGNQPQPESQAVQAAAGFQIPGSLPLPDLDQLTRTLMQTALEQMGPALLDGTAEAVGPEALKLLAGMGFTPAAVAAEIVPGTAQASLTEVPSDEVQPFTPSSTGAAEAMSAEQEAFGSQASGPGPVPDPVRRPELTVLPRTVGAVRVVVGQRAMGDERAERPDLVQAVSTAHGGPAAEAPAKPTVAGPGPELPNPGALPDLEPDGSDTPPGPTTEWALASLAAQGGQTEPPGSAPAEAPASLWRLATEPIAPERLVAALREVATEAEPGTYEITLRLSPESLGEVKVTLQLTGSEVRTMMEVVGAEARQALESGVDRLRQGLSEAGLTLSDFQVNTGLGGQQGRNPAAEWPDWLSPQARRRGGTPPPAAAPLASIQGPISLTRTARGRLNTLA